MTRQVPQGIQNYPFDLIVIGAGINGAGIARDAAMRGLKVLLLDKGDISSGTTSWSTRLIHGGLRYLEHFEVSLVRESLRERAILLHIAPHLVRPLRFLIPIYKGDKRGPAMIRLGMLAYDALSFDKSLEHHRMLSREEALRREPGLNPLGLKAAALYYDAQVEYPERLTLENVLSARDHGAVVLTYARVDRLILNGVTVRGVEFTDLLNGGRYSARAPVTVNVAGPWVDEVLKELGRPVERMIGGTKGSHLVVDSFPGAPGEALYIEASEDHRPYFIVPWNGQYLIGTTDIRYEGDLDDVTVDEEEIEYLIRETNRAIPGANLSRRNVLYVYSGVRPLPYQPAGSEGGITRRHIIYDHAPDVEGLVSIVGGKITTYRNLAQQTVDLVYRKQGKEPPACRTARLPLPGGTSVDLMRYSADFAASGALAEGIAGRLQRIYGSRASEVMEVSGSNPALRMPLSPEAGVIGAEVLFAFKREMAQTLTDLLMRRTMMGLGPEVGIGVDRAATDLAVQYLGWDESQADLEVERYREYIKRFQPQSDKVV